MKNKKGNMNTRLKLSALALLIAAPALNVHAQTNLLQQVTVGFTVYSQGTPMITSTETNNVVDTTFFGTEDLIRAVSASGTFTKGDILAHARPVTTNGTLGTGSWVIYNKGTITPISTNVYFDIYTDDAYGGTNRAYVHGETIMKDHVIKFGTTEEIRTLVLSNSVWQIKAQGYAHGHLVPVSLGGSDVAYSQDYDWHGNGSGTTTNSDVVVIKGDITENYFDFQEK
jgi:hypothetical protein